jgi:hypothetical protein
VHDDLIGDIPQDVDEDGDRAVQILESETTVVSLKAYEAIARNVGKVQDPVHAIELGVPLTDLGDTRFRRRTVVLPGLDVQLSKDIGRNGIDVGGRDAVGSKKGLDWSGHCMKFKKVWDKWIRFYLLRRSD